MKHTKGPWTLVGLEFFAENGYKIGRTYTTQARGKEGREDYEYAMGNASLIAAAPDLLEALELCQPELKQLLEDIGPCDHDVGVCCCGLVSLLDQIDAAIAKAKGE